jgi:flagellar basal-body rod modification protein FlgD
MNAVSELLSGAAGTTSSQRSSAPKTLTTQDFFQIMIAEISNQDPLEPLDNQQFLNQLTQMQALQATTKLSEGIEAMLLGQQISAAGSLIGKHVVGTGTGDPLIGGVVDRVSIVDGAVQLGIAGRLLPIESVTEILSGGAAAVT